MLYGFPQQRVRQISQQCQIPFFSLPRELRDTIYELAFGHEARQFNYHGINIAATWEPFNESATSLPGAPDWVLASRSIYHESAETFHRTRTLSPRYRQKAVKNDVTNSWLLQKDAIRNIELRYPYSSFGCAHQVRHAVLPPRMFLSYLRPFFNPAVALCIDWETGRRFYFWDAGKSSCPGLDCSIFENWQSEWFGQFWKVEVYMTTLETDADNLEDFREGAERCAKKLVGHKEGAEAGQVRWGEEMGGLNGHGVTCSRSLVVCRRIVREATR